MNKPINIQSFVCEIDKCPDIQRLKEENEKLKTWLKEERANNDKLNQLYQDEHCEVLELKEKVNSYNCSPNCYQYRKSENQQNNRGVE